MDRREDDGVAVGIDSHGPVGEEAGDSELELVVREEAGLLDVRGEDQDGSEADTDSEDTWTSAEYTSKLFNF
jgi:hypothetical protein